MFSCLTQTRSLSQSNPFVSTSCQCYRIICNGHSITPFTMAVGVQSLCSKHTKTNHSTTSTLKHSIISYLYHAHGNCCSVCGELLIINDAPSDHIRTYSYMRLSFLCFPIHFILVSVFLPTKLKDGCRSYLHQSPLAYYSRHQYLATCPT